MRASEMNPVRVASVGAVTAARRPSWSAVGADYALAAPRDARCALATAWLVLATLSLAAAGAFSLLLVAARTPQLMHLFPTFDFFRVALVVHVDLSVLVWFFAVAGMLWSLNGSTRLLALGWGALVLTALGAGLIAAAPFLAPGRAVMSNYVPVIDSAPFLIGLVVFAAGAAATTLRGLAAVQPVGSALDGAASLRFGLNTAAVAAAMALLAFGWSYLAVPGDIPRASYFEVLFWGGGHVLQFLYTLLMLIAWLVLASACGASVPLSPRVAVVMFAIALVAVFATPAIYLAHEVTSAEHRRVMTWLMRVAGGFAIVPVAAAVTIALARAPKRLQTAPLRAALIASLLLFGVGGLMGFAIEGSNTRIPAHYHGCIVGVTLALMGLVYSLVPRLGWNALPRSAALQPYVYGIGQLMHIAGLMWSGGYGVQRKVAGAEQALRTGSEIFGMGLMGAGGLLAIVGGLMFVAVVAQCAWRRSSVRR